MRRQQALGVDRLTPLGVDPDDLGPVAGRDLAHPLAEDAVDADDDRVARPDEVDEGRLHARRSGPAQREGQRIGRPEDLTQPVVRAVEDGQELRIEMAEHGTGQRHGDFRVRIRRSRPHEEAVGYPHRRIVTGPRSPAPTRRPPGRVPLDCLRGTGALRPSGAAAPPSRRVPGSRPLRGLVPRPRGAAGPGDTARPGGANLCLVMAVADADPAAVRRTLAERPPPARRLVAHRGHARGPAAGDPGAGARRHRAARPAARPRPRGRRIRRRT